MIDYISLISLISNQNWLSPKYQLERVFSLSVSFWTRGGRDVRHFWCDFQLNAFVPNHHHRDYLYKTTHLQRRVAERRDHRTQTL